MFSRSFKRLFPLSACMIALAILFAPGIASASPRGGRSHAAPHHAAGAHHARHHHRHHHHRHHPHHAAPHHHAGAQHRR